MRSDDRPLFSVVVIGFNEEARLQASLDSVIAHLPARYRSEVIYVDSGSTDRSVEIAKGIAGIEVLHLEGTHRSAARARNVGLKKSRGRFVQLVDGDSVIQPGWFDAALAVMEARDEVSCVFGQCIEMYPEQSVYMKLCGMDWHIPPGEYRLCGGNALWRRSVIAEHGFFDEALKSGEEPDLCYRVRHRGGKIICIDAPMVTHDLAMRRFGQYWNRAENSGRGYAKIASRYWRRPEKLWLRELLVNFAEPLVWLLIFVAGSLWNGVPGGALWLAGWWAIRTLQIAYAMRGRQLGVPHALLYGLHCQFVRLPVAVGQLKTLLGFR